MRTLLVADANQLSRELVATFSKRRLPGCSRPKRQDVIDRLGMPPAPTWFCSNLEMPVKDGFAALVEIRSASPVLRIPVVARDGQSHAARARTGYCRKNPASTPSITKPIDLAKLRDRVD